MDHHHRHVQDTHLRSLIVRKADTSFSDTKAKFQREPKILVTVNIHKTVELVSTSDRIVFQTNSDHVASPEFPFEYSEFMTTGGIFRSKRIRDYLFPQVNSEDSWNSFVHNASNYVTNIAADAMFRRDKQLKKIVFELELITCLRVVDDELQRVLHESIEESEFTLLPASASSIAALESTKFDGGHDTCPICIQDYLMGVKVTKMSCCSKVLHQDCIVSWLQMKNTCPLCRFSFPT